MEQALEPFPAHMVRASPLSRELFEEGRVKRSKLPRASLREVIFHIPYSIFHIKYVYILHTLLYALYSMLQMLIKPPLSL
jgi:hypothetical protein